jgi:uncharacterized protein YdbL (DUF1318 family)
MKTHNAIRPSFKVPALALLITVSAIIVGCVTVNVNFPESAVQKASDDYVRDIYRTKEQGKAPKASPAPGTSMIHFDSFISTAYAEAEVALKMDSSKIETIKGKLKARVPEILAQKKEGIVGEGNDGMLVIKDASKVKPLMKKKVEDMVKDENSDRSSLYSEIVSTNHLSSSNVSQMKKSFSRSFQSESPSGTWVQSPEGTWSQKP